LLRHVLLNHCATSADLLRQVVLCYVR